MRNRIVRYWMIAPMESKAGPQIFEAAWEYDQQYGTIAVRGCCDEESLQTVSQFASIEEFQDEVNKVKLNWSDHDFNLIWNFHREIQVGDHVIARQGGKAIRGIGTVTKTAYYDFTKGVERIGSSSPLSEKVKSYIKPRFIGVFWTVTGNFPMELTCSAIVDELTESQYCNIVKKTVINEIINNIQVPSIREALEVASEVSHLRHQPKPKLIPEKETKPSDSPTPNYYVGIDLGATNSVMAWGFTNRQTEQLEPKIVPIDMMVEHNTMRKKELLPSCVYFEAGQPPNVGEYAKKMLQRQPARVVKSVKIEMGSQKQFNFDNVTFSATEISAQILKHLAASAKSHFGFIPDEITMTVPTYFDANMRDAAIKAARIAGFRNTDLLTEPHAILLNRINEENRGETEKLLVNSRDDKLVLIFDLGGGSLDVSLHNISYHAAQKVLYIEDIAISNYTGFGGDNFDIVLANHFLDAYVEENSFKLDDFQRFPLTNIFREYAEQAKIELSEEIAFEKELGIWNEETSPNSLTIPTIIQKPFADKDFHYDLSLNEYEEIIQCFLAPDLTLDADTVEFGDNIENIIYPVHDILQKVQNKTGTFPKVDMVLLNGGMTKFHTIQKRIETFFKFAPVIPQEPDRAVARGAVVYHHKLYHDNFGWGNQQPQRIFFHHKKRSTIEEYPKLPKQENYVEPNLDTSFDLDIDSEIVTLTMNFEKLGLTNDLITQKVILEQIRAHESGILTAANADKFVVPLCKKVSSLDNFGKISVISLLGNLAEKCSDTTLLSNICDVALELVEFEKTKANGQTYVKSVVQSAVWTLGKIGSRERENPLPIQQLIPVVTSLMEQLKADFHDDIKRNSIYALAEICDRRKCANDVVSIGEAIDVIRQLVNFLNEQNGGNSSDLVSSKLQEIFLLAIQMIGGIDLSPEQEENLRAIREEN